MIRLVAFAPAGGFQEGRFGRLDAAGVQRREVQQAVWAGHRVVDVLVRQGHVLQDRQKPLLAFQPADQLRYCVQACQGMQRAAVMAWRQVGGARHGEGGGRQHGLRRHPRTQLVQGAIQDFVAGRCLDELDQRLD